MTPIQALETSIANALGSAPEATVRAEARRIITNLHHFRFTIAPLPGRVSLSEMSVGIAVKTFAEAILHGDAVHKRWLLEAADAFVEGRALPPARNAKGLMVDTPPPQEYEAPSAYERLVGEEIKEKVREAIRTIPHWNKVGGGMPLGVKLETMHQDEKQVDGYAPRINLCHARILVVGDEIEWIDEHGYSTLVNPGSFKAPTHWRWQNGSGGT